MTLELQHLCQRIQDEQGYLVIGSTIELAIGQVVGNANGGDSFGRELLPFLIVIGDSTREEYDRQGMKYSPDFVPSVINVYFYRMVAE